MVSLDDIGRLSFAFVASGMMSFPCRARGCSLTGAGTASLTATGSACCGISFVDEYEKAALFAFSIVSADGTGGIFRSMLSETFSLCSVSFLREGRRGGRDGRGRGEGEGDGLGFDVADAFVRLVLDGALLTYFGLSSEYFLVTV